MDIKKTAMEIRCIYSQSCNAQGKWKHLKDMDNSGLEERKKQFDYYYEDVKHFESAMRVNIDRLKEDPNVTKEVLIEALVEAGVMINPEIWDFLYKRVCGTFCPDLHSKMNY